MKLWPTRSDVDDEAVRALEDELRSLRTDRRLPDSRRSGLLVRTNERIDNVTSGKALTISWAARVAIPGVVAILSFLVALSYYVPETQNRVDELAGVLQAMPSTVVDSLAWTSASMRDSVTLDVAGEAFFGADEGEMAEYLIDRGASSTVGEALSDDEVRLVLAALATDAAVTR